MLFSDHMSDRIGRALARSTAVCVPVAMACAAGVALDDRELLGERVWVKPLKFAVSIGLTGAATAWLRNRLPSPRRRGAERAVLAIIVALIGEQLLITMQAVRGVRSHFNTATAFDGAVFNAMGVLVMVAFVGLLVLALQTTRRPPADPVIGAVARWGTWLVVGGSSVGFALVAANAHTIGGPDGGPGLPLVGWSTELGDLRPAHFVGLHGLQALILVGAMARRSRWSTARTLLAVRAVGTGIAALASALLVQAYASQPVSSASSVAVAAVAGLAAWVGHRWPRRRAPVAGVEPVALSEARA